MKKTTKKAEKKQEFTQEAAEKFYKEHVTEMTATMLELGARKDKVLADEPQAMMRYFDMTEEQAVEFVNNMRTTAACTAGTGENTTKTNDVQAVVTETTVADVLMETDAKNKKLWQVGTTVAKYLAEDGVWSELRENGGKYYMAGGEGNAIKGIAEFDYNRHVKTVRKAVAKRYNSATELTLNDIVLNAVMGDVAQNNGDAILEWHYGDADRVERDILTAYGLL